MRCRCNWMALRHAWLRQYPYSPPMCGIVGYVGGRPCRDLLVAGLEKLEYRGYDSAGISLLTDGHVETVRAVGNLSNLRAAIGLDADTPVSAEGGVAVATPPATIGLGHTRWAMHGRVTEENAHPHGDCTGDVHIVLNGIVENHTELRRELVDSGHQFTSETDAEIVAHMIEKHYDGDLTAAVRAAFAELRGHYAFVAMHASHPDTLVAARQECPLIVGIGDGETFVASAIPAFLAHTRKVLGMKNGEIVTVTPDGARIVEVDGTQVDRDVEEVTWDEEAAEKGGYPTFMLKEIHEQPGAVAETIADRLPEIDRVDQDRHRTDGGDVPTWALARPNTGGVAAGEDRRGGGRAQGHPLEDRDDAHGGRRAGPRDRPLSREARLLPLSRAQHRSAGVPGGRAQDEGDLLYPDRRVRGRRDEARADRPPGRIDPGRLRRDRQPHSRKGSLQRRGGPGPRRRRHRDRHRRQHRGGTGGRPDPLRTGDRLGAPADPGHPSAPAARLLRRPPERSERGSAAESRQDGDGRVIRRAAIVLAALVTVLLLAGCGGGSGSNDELASLAPANAPVYVESVVRPEGAQRDAID